MPFVAGAFQYIKKNSLIFRTMLLFFVVGAFVMFLVSGLIMGIIKGQYIQEIEEKSRQYMEQSYSITELLFESLYNRLFQVYSSDDVIIKAMYGEALRKSDDYMMIFTRLREEVKSNRLVRSLYIYNPGADAFFYCFNGAAGIAGRAEMFDRDAVLMVEDQNEKPVFLSRKVKFTDTYGAFTVDENWISVFFGLNRGTGTPAFIVNIDQGYFQKLIEGPLFDKGHATLVIDRNGVIISDSDPDMINKNLCEDELYRMITGSGLANDSFTYHPGRGGGGGVTDYLVTYKKSPSLGWVFIGLGNKAELLANFNRIQTVMTVISVLFMLASLVISFFLSKYMYTPLYDLMRTVNDIKNQKDLNLSMKVYDDLRHEYLDLVSTVQKLESGIERFTEMKARAVAVSETRKNEWVQMAADYINRNFSNGTISIETIAEHIGLSPNYLRAIFKAVKGISLSKYLTDTRLEYVKKMLVETNMHVHEIVERAGFLNAKHFYVIFKQSTGLTAEMYRKKYGDGGIDKWKT